MKFVIALAVASGCAMTANAQLINEFRPNPTGADPAMTTFEFSGTAGASFDATLYSLDSDFASGSVDREYAISGIFDVNGLFTQDVADLENPSFTLILSSVSGLLGSTVDALEDGIIDLDFGTVYDALNITDTATADSRGWATQLGGIDMGYSGDEPMLSFRDSVSGKWWSINDPAGSLVYGENGVGIGGHVFNMDPIASTFGGINPTVPTPGAAVLLGLGGLMATRRRRA